MENVEKHINVFTMAANTSEYNFRQNILEAL